MQVGFLVINGVGGFAYCSDLFHRRTGRRGSVTCGQGP